MTAEYRQVLDYWYTKGYRSKSSDWDEDFNNCMSSFSDRYWSGKLSSWLGSTEGKIALIIVEVHFKKPNKIARG